MTSLLRAATVVSSLTLSSRLLGLARDLIMFRALGPSWVTGTFVLAWTLPNTMRRWFGEGALAAAFVPAYTRELTQHGDGAAGRLLAGVCGALLLILGGGAAAVAAATRLWPVDWLPGNAGGADPGEHGRLLLDLVAILFPYVLPICLVAILGGALNSRGSFALPAAAPAVLNLFWIGGIAFAAGLCDLEPVRSIYVLAVALVAGGIAQLSITAIALLRRGALPPPRLPAHGDPARGVFRAMLPTAIGLSVGQLTVLVNQVFAWTLLDASANSFLYLADRIVLFPHGLTGLAMATAAFPRFAALATQGELTMLRRQIDRAFQVTWFLALPATAGLLLVAGDLFRIGFVGQRFSMADAERATQATAMLALGLPFLGLSQLTARALYALGDVRGPAQAALIVFGVNLLLAPGLGLALGLGVPGLTLAMSLGALLNSALLYARLHRHCPGPLPHAAGLLRIAAATAGMVPAVLAVRGLLGWQGRAGEAVDLLLLPILAGSVVYLLLAHLLGSEELQSLRRRVNRSA